MAFWDTHMCRIIDAWGPSVVKYVNHFTHVPADDTTRNPSEWKWVSDTATDSVTLPVSVTGGVMQLATGAVDNNETYLQLGGATSATNAPWVIGGAAGIANGYPLYFGARVKCTTHVDGAWFVGMAGEGASAGNFLVDDSGAVADDDFVGFNILTATPAAWNITWRNAGQAVQAVTAVAVNADNWHIFEFWYDGVTTVKFFIDGTLNATVATTTAGTFPGGEELSPILGCKSGDGAAKVLQIDWLRVFSF
jgi:hypothetical protein